MVFAISNDKDALMEPRDALNRILYFPDETVSIILASSPPRGITVNSDNTLRLSAHYSQFKMHQCLGNIAGDVTAFQNVGRPGYYLRHTGFVLFLHYATDRY